MKKDQGRGFSLVSIHWHSSPRRSKPGALLLTPIAIYTFHTTKQDQLSPWCRDQPSLLIPHHQRAQTMCHRGRISFTCLLLQRQSLHSFLPSNPAANRDVECGEHFLFSLTFSKPVKMLMWKGKQRLWNLSSWGYETQVSPFLGKCLN